MTNGAKTLAASKGRPRANSAACDRTKALSSSARRRPDAGSPSRHDALASPPAGDGAPGSDVADRLARLETLDLSAMRPEWRRLYRAEPPRLSRDLMTRALGYRIQEIAFGRLSKATLLRGLDKVALEWGLVCLAHNMLKLARGGTSSAAKLATA